MTDKICILTLLLCWAAPGWAQHKINIDATLKASDKTISISQTIVYKNTSEDILREIYLFDWANSFSSKTTPLAKRFAENYESSFHFEKDENRGKTKINKVYSDNRPLQWQRGKEADILRIIPSSPILPGEDYSFSIEYSIKVPDDKFTRFGVTKENDYKLRHWFISPAAYNGQWQVYSNKNTDDLYLTPSQFSIDFNYPALYKLSTDLDVVSESFSQEDKMMKTSVLTGDNRTSVELFLEKNPSFDIIETDKFKVVNNLQHSRITPPLQSIIIDRVVHYLDSKLGPYPFEKMLISDADYRTNPVYGLNQLPNFISPFPDGFEYDMEQLKTISRNYIKNTLILNPRTDYWLQDALQIYLMMEYVDRYYPKMKIIGGISEWWFIRWAHISDLEFNDQYDLLYMNMARHNIHQALNVQKDSLLKFNKNIANPYYGGSGLKYLEDYIGKEVLQKTIKSFYANHKLHPITTSDFERELEKNTPLPINWFFDEYIQSRSTIDFKIKKVEKKADSLEVIIKNKRDARLPISLYGLDKKDNIVFKTWTTPTDSITSVTVPSANVRRLALNYEGIIPEYNRQNNFKTVTGLLNRPIQFRLFQDLEDPNYTQIFFMPIFQYNLYDGITAGVRLNNKTLLPQAFEYTLNPQFASKSRTLVGSGSVKYTQFMDEENLYAIRYGFAGTYYSYNQGLFYRRLSPFLTFSFRSNNLRSNKKQHINLRSVTVHRDKDPFDKKQDPNYSVFNLQYVYSNPNLINYFRGVMDYQISSKFGKISADVEYRKLFLNNRQLNLRFFAGAFIFNDTRTNEDFFSFALDRASDYMFDYEYYGRSERHGLFSQQLIITEGGFKSQLQPAFANSWITTINASTNIWRWIYAYADAGLVHNSHLGTSAVYDSGVRLSLVADYFELYFPVYSNLGFEPGLPRYDQRIRFIITLRPKTLFGLFTRRWY